MLKVIETPKAPAAIGPYSQAIVQGGTLYTSGQIPIDAASGGNRRRRYPESGRTSNEKYFIHFGGSGNKF